MCRKAIYPGTFDPVTFGHLDLIERAARIFDEVIIAIAENLEKKPLFSLEERVAMIKKATLDFDNVSVEAFDELVVDYARRKKISVIIRGLRMISDFEFEFQMVLTNRKLASDIETIFLMPSESLSYISSKLLKEAAFLGADLKEFLPDFVEVALKKRLKAR